MIDLPRAPSGGGPRTGPVRPEASEHNKAERELYD
jgi:hypothetical protein